MMSFRESQSERRHRFIPRCAFTPEGCDAQSGAIPLNPLDAEYGCRSFWMATRSEIVAQEGNKKPKHLRSVSNAVVFSAQRFGTIHSENPVASRPHFFSRPAGEMLLQITVVAILGHETVRRG